MESEKFLDVLFAHEKTVRGVALDLRVLASAFEQTGNAFVAGTLRDLAGTISESAEWLWRCHGEAQAKDLSDAQARVGETLKEILGAFGGQEDGDECSCATLVQEGDL